jgi:hypothetical protein
MAEKVWLSNVGLVDTVKIMEAFPGVSVGLPRAVGKWNTKILCQHGIAGLYATERRAKELTHERNE